MKIGLIGEAPGDTNAIKNLLSRQTVFGGQQFCILLANIHGSQLDNQKTKRLLRIEYETEKPDIVIFIRDLDGLENDTAALAHRRGSFTDFNSVVNKTGIYLLNIFELEALIVADLATFNQHFNTSLQYEEDAMLLPNPKEFLREGCKKYWETHNPELFKLLVYETLLSNCRYFETFTQRLIAKIISPSP